MTPPLVDLPSLYRSARYRVGHFADTDDEALLGQIELLARPHLRDAFDEEDLGEYCDRAGIDEEEAPFTAYDGFERAHLFHPLTQAMLFTEGEGDFEVVEYQSARAPGFFLRVIYAGSEDQWGGVYLDPRSPAPARAFVACMIFYQIEEIVPDAEHPEALEQALHLLWHAAGEGELTLEALYRRSPALFEDTAYGSKAAIRGLMASIVG